MSDSNNVFQVVKNSEDIFFNIDEFAFDKKMKKVFLRGWSFHKEDSVEISVLNNKLFSLDKHLRGDVFTAFNSEIMNSLDSGFLLNIDNVLKNDELLITLKSNNENVDIKVFVNKIVTVNKYSKLKKYFSFKYLKMSFEYIKLYGFKNFFFTIKERVFERKNLNEYDLNSEYLKWISYNENYIQENVFSDIEKFKEKPLISVVMPVYNVDEKWLRLSIDSVINQYYTNWELCIADDCSPKAHIKKVLEEYKKKDDRIKVVYRKENGHISNASNSAIEIATGTFIALLDNDDELPRHAFFEVVKAINDNPNVDLIYSDEDKIDVKNNRKDPHFKPNWSPDTLLSCNYISHLGVYRKSLIDKLGGFRVGYEGAQDYDLVLRFTELTKVENIVHIPKVLYHWRTVEGSTAAGFSEKSYAFDAGIKALEDTVIRRKYDAKVKKVEGTLYYNVQFEAPKDTLVSIIIPTKNGYDILKICLESIYENSKNIKFEVIVIDNGSTDEKVLDLLNYYKESNNNFRVLTLNIPFNYSKLNNEAAKIAKGNLLLFLNNDIKVITGNWLEIMAGEACREEIGVVGAKLLYPNDTIQHAGVILGIGGVAGHSHLFTDNKSLGNGARLRIVYNYSALTGACMMVRKRIFDKVEGFDESLTVAFNDIDLCIKILQEGLYNILLPEVELYHYESISRGKEDTPEKKIRFLSEIDIMKNKWSDILDNDDFYNKNLTLDSHDFRIRRRN